MHHSGVNYCPQKSARIPTEAGISHIVFTTGPYLLLSYFGWNMNCDWKDDPRGPEPTADRGVNTEWVYQKNYTDKRNDVQL